MEELTLAEYHARYGDTRSTKERRPARHPEADAQRAIIRWRDEHMRIIPALAWLNHSPNGEARPGRTGAILVSLGTLPGVPDLMLYWRSGRYCGLAIELKARKVGASPAQAAWLEHLATQGWLTRLVADPNPAVVAARAIEIIADYIGIDQRSGG